MRSGIRQPSHQRSRLDSGRRLARVLARLARAVATSLYCRQRQYITVKRLDVPDAVVASRALAAERETECFVVDSVEALDAVAPEIPAGFRDSVDELKNRLAQGCVVCLARRPRMDGAGTQIIGYEIAERGIFSALGRRTRLAADVVFSHYVEVHPSCRGQRIHGLLFATRDAYFRRRGGKVVCGVVAPQNRASLQALGRDGSVIVGTVERISLLRGLLMWDTPLERIESALRSLERGERALGSPVASPPGGPPPRQPSCSVGPVTALSSPSSHYDPPLNDPPPPRSGVRQGAASEQEVRHRQPASE